MTEGDWLGCTTPGEMLTWLHGRVTDRKLRLFAAACCRTRWDALVDERSRASVVAGEQYADRHISVPALKSANHAARQATKSTRCALASAAAALSGPLDPPRLLLVAGACAHEHFASITATAEAWLRRRHWQCHALRDIMPNPFQTVAYDPAWLNGEEATLLAGRIYDHRDFARLPALADLLERSGCDNYTLLEHCRSGVDHVRGCWAVDLVLGKG